MLLRTLKEGERVTIGQGITLHVCKTSPSRVKIGICAPDDQVIRFYERSDNESIQDERACPSSCHSQERP
jgi:sRNA-binding carbon storage regulator CsrA